MMNVDVDVKWFDRGTVAVVPPNPAYPNGLTVDLRTSPLQAGCAVELPYPAKRCGQYLIACNRCGNRTVVTTAGRSDDPRKVTLRCKGH